MRGRTNLERLVEKSVDDWVDTAVGHGEPDDNQVGQNEAALLLGARSLAELDDDEEDVQRKPAQAEQRHDAEEHASHLSTE